MQRTAELQSLAAIVDDVADAVLIVDADAIVRYANAATTDVLGHAPEDLVGRSYEVLVPPEVRGVHAGHHGHYLADPVARPMGRGLILRARHAEGYDIDVTIALVPIRNDTAMVAAIIRELTRSQREISRLAATNDVLTAALGGATRHDAEQRCVELACELLEGEASWLVTGDAGEARAIAASPPDAEVPPDGVGDVIDCPIASPTAPMTLRVRRNGRPFGSADQEMLCEFAATVAITLELIDARSEVEVLRTVADHDRIARDLHDRVIQRLFAIAMGLESVVTGAEGVTRLRVGEAVDDLDDVIREIRTTIFGLRRSGGPPGLRAAIAGEIDRVTQALGFAPSLRFVGSTDDGMETGLSDDASMALREMLSNVARHSRARNVDVLVRTDDRVLDIVVDDDGVGYDAGSAAGEGLANLRARATARGGSFRIGRREPTGTRAEWTVPLVRASA